MPKHGCFYVSFHTRTTLSTVPKARHEVGDSAKEVKTLGAWKRPFSSLQQRTPSKFLIDQPRTLLFSILSSFVKSSSFICPFSFNYGSFAFMQEWWKINIKLPYGNRPVKKKQMRGNRSFWWEARATKDISICCYTAFPVFPTTENPSFCDLHVQLLFPGISLLLLIK